MLCISPATYICSCRRLIQIKLQRSNRRVCSRLPVCRMNLVIHRSMIYTSVLLFQFVKPIPYERTRRIRKGSHPIYRTTVHEKRGQHQECQVQEKKGIRKGVPKKVRTLLVETLTFRYVVNVCLSHPDTPTNGKQISCN